MNSDHIPSVTTDDTPRVASLTEAQSTVAVTEGDMRLLVAAVAAVLNGHTAPSLAAEDRTRLRQLNTVLYRELSARGRQEVRDRTAHGAVLFDQLRRDFEDLGFNLIGIGDDA